MKKRNVNTNLVAALLVVIAVLGYGLIGRAGMEPDAPPGDTMKTLQEIYDAVVLGSPTISQREGYCKFFNTSSGDTILVTVPEGKRFVLRKLWVNNNFLVWNLSGGPNFYIHANIMRTSSGAETLMWDFPDGCAVIEGGDTLSFSSSSPAPVSIVGYFYDVP